MLQSGAFEKGDAAPPRQFHPLEQNRRAQAIPTQASPSTQFLDDMTLAQLEQELGVPVIPSGENRSQLLDHLQASDRHLSGMNLPQGAYNP